VPDTKASTAGIMLQSSGKAVGIADEVASRLKIFANGATAMKHLAASDANGRWLTQATSFISNAERRPVRIASVGRRAVDHVYGWCTRIDPNRRRLKYDRLLAAAINASGAWRGASLRPKLKRRDNRWSKNRKIPQWRANDRHLCIPLQNEWPGDSAGRPPKTYSTSISSGAAAHDCSSSKD